MTSNRDDHPLSEVAVLTMAASDGLQLPTGGLQSVDQIPDRHSLGGHPDDYKPIFGDRMIRVWIVIESRSSKTVLASANPTLCFLRFVASFFPSHSNARLGMSRRV